MQRIRMAGALMLALTGAIGAGGTASPGGTPTPGTPELRGLSPQEIEDLQTGRGMGLARAADLAGYPGPRHVLDATETGQLRLTSAQLAAVRRLFASMEAEARHLGAQVLEEEGRLEAAFRDRTITDAELTARLGRIAALRAELRAVHLRAHLETRAVLDPAQLQRYDELRGHSATHPHP